MAKRKRRSPNKTNSPINKRSRHRSAHKGLSVEPLEDRRLLAADLGGGVTDVWQSYVPAEFLTDPSVVVAEPDTDGNIRVIIETMGKQENLAVLDAFSPAARNATPLSEFPIVIANVPVEDLDDISQLPNVRSVSVDYSIPATLADSVELINADVLHDNGNRGAGTTIAILDSGIDDTHDFFGTNGSRIVAERCFSTADAAGQQSLCPNGQATDVSASVDIAACLDGSDSLCEHGTHVAGIAAGSASTDSSAPGDGVAPGANIIAIQVFHRNNTNCGTKPTPCVRANSSDIIAGLDAVAALDAANPSLNIVAANMSLGSGGANRTHCDGTTPAMTTAINDLLFDRGIATVIAAGNSGFKRSVSFPGCISSAFTVGSTTNGDDISSFSNRAALLDVFAPGGGDGLLGTGGISSSVPGGEYGSKSGTSMAAPHVAGALAVLREANPARPTVDLMNDLVSNGVPITYTEFGTSVTTPRIDVLASVGGDNNDQISEATEILLGSTNTSNALGESYDVDMFEFSVLGGVQRVVIEVTERNNSNVDPFLRLFDENGTELANDSNNGSSAEIDFVLPGSGTYFVGVSAENNEAYNPFTGFGDSEGDAGGSFTLTISDNNDQISEAIPLSLNEPQNGNINLNTDIDLFEFNATAGQTVSFDIDRRDSSDLDSFLRLFSPDGNTVLALDDDDNNPDGPLPEVSNLESFIRFTFPTTDTYYLGVSSFGNSSYNLFDDSGDTAGSTTGPYSLTAFIDNLDANDQISEAINIPVGTSNGIFQLFSSLDVTMFSTDVTAGQTVGFDVDNTADSSLDAELRLWDEEGNLLAIDDDTNGPVPEFNNFEPYIEHTFNDAGRYYFSVAVFNNDEFDPISGLFDNGTAPGGSYGVSVTDETITEPANRRLVTIADDIVGLDGETSLREAIDFANSNPGDDTITFAPALHGSTVELTQGELDVTRPTILVGPGANLLTISANYNSRIFDAFSSLTIQDMTLADGHATQNGGAILGQNVTVTRSRLLNNTAGNQGGAIHITGFGNLTVSDSEFSGNSADEGGAISLNGGSGFLAQGTVTNSTISGNTANDGGAIYSRGTNLTVRSSTVAFNSSGITSVANPYSTNALVSASIVAENGREDFDGEVILSESLLGSDHNTTINFSQSVDFIQDREPMLEPLAFNGASATRTHKLLPNSPAINAATASGQTPGFDQAGNDRVRLSHLDMGAYESNYEGLSGEVTITGDVVALDGETSLREAIDAANTDGFINRITFAPNLNGQTILVEDGEILIEQTISIEGPGANQLTIDAGGSSRILKLNSGSDDDPGNSIDDPTFFGEGATFTIKDVTITGGAVSATQSGGAIDLEDSFDTLVLDRVVISNSFGNGGGALRLKGQYIIQDSTLTGNTANFAGAAILALGESNGAIINSTVSDNTSNSGLATIQAQSDSNLSMQISNSTIADNTAPGVGFFGYNGGTGAVTITNSLFADNNGNTVTNDPAVVISGGHNLSDDGSLEFNGTGDITNMAATLGPLQNNGGATPTHLPLPGSPAINAGEPGFTGLNRDQRGATRVRGGRLDIGAVEIQGDLPVFTSSPTASIPENSSATIQSVNANGPGTSYSITGNGDDDSLFQIVNGNQLRFTAGRDFENPTDANGDNVYEVEIMASSSVGLAVTQTVSVTVTPLNDNSPIFTSSDNNVIPENTTAVQTLTASDADLPGQTVSFAITGGPDSSQFQIVNGNQLQFVNAPDFENPADSNANNIYAVQLTANDGNGLTTDQSFSVRVADVVEDSLLCDFDADADCDGADINALQANLANGPADPSTFDLTGDGQVTLADRDEWLALAGAENLTSGNPYRVGDANLDGSVDISDFNLWNANKFTSNSDWTSADFSADGSVDISDFNLWNSNKFQSSDSAIRGLSNRHDRNQRDHSNESDINLVDRLFAEWMVPSNL